MIEWMQIKREIQWFIVSLLLMVLSIGIVEYFHTNEMQQWRNSQREMLQARAKYKQAKNKQALIEQYKNEFKKYQENGIYGDEKRINWVETIQRSADMHQIPSVKVKILQRRKLDMNEISDLAGGIDVYTSSMNLDFALVHEGDLFTLLNDLDTKAHGLYGVKSCTIRNNYRDLDSVVDSHSSTNFSGTCDLTWFTVEKERFDDENQDQGDAL